MIAGFQECQQGSENGGFTGAECKAAPATFDLCHRLLQGESGWRAMAAIKHLAIFAVSRLFKRRNGRIQDRRGVIYRDVDNTAMPFCIATQRG